MKTSLLIAPLLIALMGAGCAPEPSTTPEPAPTPSTAQETNQAPASTTPDSELPAEFQDHLDEAIKELKESEGQG